MTEVFVENVRFFDYEPKAIHCMDYEGGSQQLALSRSNHDIEIWDCHHRPHRIKIIPGSDERTVEALVWVNSRLFSAGLDGHVTEYDLDSLSPKSTTAVTGGPTWCLALSSDKKKLAAGTEQGYVCLFDVTEEGLLYDRVLNKQEGRVLSVGWHSGGEHIATGSVDVVRLLSLKDGQISGFKVGRSEKKRETIVWRVVLLDDMTIVTADSRGKTCFWDGRLGTLLDGVQTHRADVLCLQVEPSQEAVYVAGVEPVITMVCRVTTGAKKGRSFCWVRSLQRQIHTHDVRALALAPDGKLYSGGVDTELLVSYAPPKTMHRYPSLPAEGSMSVAEEARSIALRYSDRVEVWRLGRAHDESGRNMSGGLSGRNIMPLMEDRVKLLELSCSKSDSVLSCALSPKGDWLAFLTHSRVPRIFHFTTPGVGSEAVVRRVRGLNGDIRSLQLHWIDNQRLLSVAPSGVIQILLVNELEVEVGKSMTLPSNKAARLVSVSRCCSWIAAVHSLNDVTILSVATGEVFVTLPRRSAAPTALAFHPTSGDLVVAYDDMIVIEFSLKLKRYTDFSKRLNSPNGLPRDWEQRSTVISGITLSSWAPQLILLNDASYFISIDKSKFSVPKRPGKVAKRGADVTCTEGNKNKENIDWLRETKRNNRILMLQSVGNVDTSAESSENVVSKSLVSVELSPLTLLEKLPAPFKRKKYGGV